MFAPSMLAQQTSSNSSGGLPTVEEQLKVLTGKLDLTGDQQTKIKPILQDLHDATQKLMEDKSLSNEERLAKVRPQRMNADSRIRSILNDDQKKKLDQYEQGPHGEMHGSLRGTTQPPRQPPNV
jgi:Spy/CpxP family protein refolding chaperone